MGRSILVLVDLIGGALVLTCAAAFVWFTFLREDGADSEIESLTQAVTAMRQDLAEVNAELDAGRARLGTKKTELAAEGQLPERGPVDEDLRVLTELARRHQVEIVRMTELPSRRYPGLLELRYTLDARAPLSNLMDLFRALEQADIWADISYLKVVAGNAPGQVQQAERLAQLTVSLFSSAEPTQTPEGTG